MPTSVPGNRVIDFDAGFEFIPNLIYFNYFLLSCLEIEYLDTVEVYLEIYFRL